MLEADSAKTNDASEKRSGEQGTSVREDRLDNRRGDGGQRDTDYAGNSGDAVVGGDGERPRLDRHEPSGVGDRQQLETVSKEGAAAPTATENPRLSSPGGSHETASPASTANGDAAKQERARERAQKLPPGSRRPEAWPVPDGAADKAPRDAGKPPAGIRESKGASPLGDGYRSASGKPDSAMKTSINPDLGESKAYQAALRRREIGIERPQGANRANRADFITAIEQGDKVRLVVTDVETSMNGTFSAEKDKTWAEKKQTHPKWDDRLRDAISKDRLKLGDEKLEDRIRAAYERGGVTDITLRHVKVDMSNDGQGRITGIDGGPVPGARDHHRPTPEAKETKPIAEQFKQPPEQPKQVTEQLKPAVEQPQRATEQPKAAAEQPKPVAEQPIKEQPKPATEQPKQTTEPLKQSSEQPKAKDGATEKPSEPAKPKGEAAGKTATNAESRGVRFTPQQAEAAAMGVVAVLDKLDEIGREVQNDDARKEINAARRQLVDDLNTRPGVGAVIEVQFLEPEHNFQGVFVKYSDDPDAGKPTKVWAERPTTSYFINVEPMRAAEQKRTDSATHNTVDVQSAEQFIRAYGNSRGGTERVSANTLSIEMYDAIQKGTSVFGQTTIRVGQTDLRLTDNARSAVEGPLKEIAQAAVLDRISRLQGGIDTLQKRLNDQVGGLFGGGSLTGHELDNARAHFAAANNYYKDGKYASAAQSIDAGHRQLVEVHAQIYEAEHGHRPAIPLMG
jgi:hypothetical protein